MTDMIWQIYYVVDGKLLAELNVVGGMNQQYF